MSAPLYLPRLRGAVAPPGPPHSPRFLSPAGAPSGPAVGAGGGTHDDLTAVSLHINAMQSAMQSLPSHLTQWVVQRLDATVKTATDPLHHALLSLSSSLDELRGRVHRADDVVQSAQTAVHKQLASLQDHLTRTHSGLSALERQASDAHSMQTRLHAALEQLRAAGVAPLQQAVTAAHARVTSCEAAVEGMTTRERALSAQVAQLSSSLATALAGRPAAADTATRADVTLLGQQLSQQVRAAEERAQRETTALRAELQRAIHAVRTGAGLPPGLGAVGDEERGGIGGEAASAMASALVMAGGDDAAMGSGLGPGGGWAARLGQLERGLVQTRTAVTDASASTYAQYQDLWARLERLEAAHAATTAVMATQSAAPETETLEQQQRRLWEARMVSEMEQLVRGADADRAERLVLSQRVTDLAAQTDALQQLVAALLDRERQMHTVVTHHQRHIKAFRAQATALGFNSPEATRSAATAAVAAAALATAPLGEGKRIGGEGETVPAAIERARLAEAHEHMRRDIDRLQGLLTQQSALLTQQSGRVEAAVAQAAAAQGLAQECATLRDLTRGEQAQVQAQFGAIKQAMRAQEARVAELTTTAAATAAAVARAGGEAGHAQLQQQLQQHAESVQTVQAQWERRLEEVRAATETLTKAALEHEQERGEREAQAAQETQRLVTANAALEAQLKEQQARAERLERERRRLQERQERVEGELAQAQAAAVSAAERAERAAKAAAEWESRCAETRSQSAAESEAQVAAQAAAHAAEREAERKVAEERLARVLEEHAREQSERVAQYQALEAKVSALEAEKAESEVERAAMASRLRDKDTEAAQLSRQVRQMKMEALEALNSQVKDDEKKKADKAAAKRATGGTTSGTGTATSGSQAGSGSGGAGGGGVSVGGAGPGDPNASRVGGGYLAGGGYASISASGSQLGR